MSTKVRQPLARLVSKSEVCETGFPGPHSAGVIQVHMRCGCGHGTPDDYEPTPACAHCLRRISAFIESGDPLVCGECSHACGLDVTAEWADGRSVILHFPPCATPEGMRWVPLSESADA